MLGFFTAEGLVFWIWIPTTIVPLNDVLWLLNIPLRKWHDMLNIDTVLVLKDLANWWIIWDQISSPETAPWIPWSRMNECNAKTIPLWAELIFELEVSLCLKFPLWEHCLHRPCFLTELELVLLFFLMSSTRSDKTPWRSPLIRWRTWCGCCCQEWDEFLIVSDCQNAMTSSDHSMKDGLPLSNDISWGTFGLSRWSWVNIWLLFLLLGPDSIWISWWWCDNLWWWLVSWVVLTRQMIVFMTCSATMANHWQQWPGNEATGASSERDFDALNCTSIWARGAWDNDS